MKNKKDLKQLLFKDLIDINEWQKVQDTFSKIINVSLRTMDSEGKPLTVPTGEPRLCKELLKETPYGTDVCGPCLPTFLGGKAVIDKNLSFICPPGFHNFIAPLRIDNKVVAYTILGPVVLVMRRTKEQYSKLAGELDVDLEKLWQEIQEIRVISFHRVQSLVELIKRVGEYILELSYDNLTGGKKVIKTASQKIKELLDLLLNVAMQVSGADMGSIMFLEKNKEELTIRVAEGLPDDVVIRTRVKLGEGVSGIVAKEGKSILVDENLSDNRIRKYLYRPYLKSSMVLPIQADEKVFGVLNLGALEVSSVRFNADNIEAMSKLIDLTTDILYSPLKQHIQKKSEYFEKLL
jgi:ligand-binding sensor protein/putative methionine-R-sulfoxide reductase with GAF domain